MNRGQGECAPSIRSRCSRSSSRRVRRPSHGGASSVALGLPWHRCLSPKHNDRAHPSRCATSSKQSIDHSSAPRLAGSQQPGINNNYNIGVPSLHNRTHLRERKRHAFRPTIYLAPYYDVEFSAYAPFAVASEHARHAVISV